MKNKSHNFKVGEPVVYTHTDGSSLSARVLQVSCGAIVVEWFPRYAQQHTALVLEKDFNRVVPFGNSLFLAL